MTTAYFERFPVIFIIINKKYDTEQPWQSKHKTINELKIKILQPRALRVSSCASTLNLKEYLFYSMTTAYFERFSDFP